jgi:hypothetical protein
MDNNDKKPSWRDKIGSNADTGKLPRLADQFDGPGKSERQASIPEATPGRLPPPVSRPQASVLPPPASKPEPSASFAEESLDAKAGQSFAERLRARREEAELAGVTSADSVGGGLHLRPPVADAPDEQLAPIAPPPPSLRPAPINRVAEPQEPPAAPLPPPSPVLRPPVPATEPVGLATPDFEPETIPPAPPAAARPEYDYAARSRAPVETAPPLVASPPVHQPVPGYPPAAAVGTQPDYGAPQPNYTPAPQNHPGAYQNDYDNQDRHHGAVNQGSRSAHARELDYDDAHGYAPSHAGGRATASDYEDAYNDYDDHYEEEPRSRRGPLMLFLGLAAIGLIAAGLIFWFMQNQSPVKTTTAPPVVAPQTAPVKVATPTLAPAQSPQQTKLFYDRIVGEETVETERIVPREEQPLDPGQSAPQPAASQPIQGAGEPVPLKPLNPSDLVPGELPVPLPPPLPGGQSGALQPSDPLSQQTQQMASSQPAKGSRIVVDPAGASGKQSLGTVNTQGGAANPGQNATAIQSAGLSDPAPPPPASGAAPPIPRAKPVQLAKIASDNAAARLAAATVSSPPVSNAATGVGQGGPLNLTPSNQPAPPLPSQQVASLPQATPPAPAPQPVQQAQPAPQPAPQPSQQAAVNDGSYVVQLASYRDAGSARNGFQDMKSRHPGLLGNYQSYVSETKVGAFGTFYRLQVGPVASAQSARQICSSLLAAGEKDCIVKRR